nr:MAG TPA: hypothetical protein [Bacteriophage sp.]
MVSELYYRKKVIQVKQVSLIMTLFQSIRKIILKTLSLVVKE